MKNFSLLPFVFCFFSANLQSQDCPMFNLEITTQQEIDNFPLNYPSCTVISRTLDITGDDITNLLGLSGITNINTLNIHSTPNLLSLDGLDSLRAASIIFISATGIQNMQGLNSLESIDLVMAITHNNSLIDLTGLESLQFISGGISIDNNSNLASLNGLNELVESGSLGIYENLNLTSLSALASVQKADQIYIADNAKLIDLKGLEKISVAKDGVKIKSNPLLTTINLDELQSAKSLEISGNSSLQSLNGLESLRLLQDDLNSTGNDLIISNNFALTSISALSNLESIGNLQIDFNDKLSSLNGLESLSNISGYVGIIENNSLQNIEGLSFSYPVEFLSIRFNSNLSKCAVTSVCNHLINGGMHEIGGNFSGCLSVDEVLEQCTVSADAPGQNKNTVIYPNPTTGTVNWSNVDDVVLVTISDVQGRIISSHSVSNNTIDITELTQGLYFLSLQKQDDVFVFPLIKK